jgi:hypothetical protein
MYSNQIYASGIQSVLKVHWKLRCETPLAIRNGLFIGYQDNDQKKSRGMGLQFKWQPPSDDRQISALHYGYKIVNNKVEAYHFVPPSSVRGSLRSWTINHLVHPSYRNGITPPKKEDEIKTKEYQTKIQKALSISESGYHLIASLFGQASDTSDNLENFSNAGRLQIETTPFSQAEALPIAVNGLLDGDGLAGPFNADRQMTVRNPLDRMTHASKESGLHHFLEFCRGETFEIEMTMLNPQGSDLGILSLWQREIKDGLLRFGALSSIGRGRVSINELSYKLWLNPLVTKPEWLKHFEPASDESANDALAGLWESYSLPSSSLDLFVSYLQEEI